MRSLTMFWIICAISFEVFLQRHTLAEYRSFNGRSGCFHNGTVFANGSLVPSIEPCLSCTCNVNTLICSLRVCPEMPVPPPRGCILVQRKNNCCSYLSCKKYHAPYDGPNRRIVAYLDYYERETIDRVVSDNVLQRRSDDSDLDTPGDICVLNGTVYKSGSAMSSSSLCSYCYCIGGVQKCVKPKCMLNMDGCKPIYVDSTCCPVRYDCSAKMIGNAKSSRYHIIRSGNKHYLRVIGRTQHDRGCIINSTYYHEGQKVPADPEKNCHICFCIRGSRQCAPKKCAPPLKNCIPVVPKGQCCPSSYDCNHTREPGRQFDFFSILFGSELNPNSTTTTVVPELSETTNVGLLSSTEKSIFDTIRQGLEFIDTNESTVGDVLKTLNIINVTDANATTETVTEEYEDPDENVDDLSFFEILLGSDKKVATENITEDGDEIEEDKEEVESVVEGNPTEGLTTTETVLSTEEPKTTIDYSETEEQDEYLYSTTEDKSSTGYVDEDVENETEENELDGKELPNTTEFTSSNESASDISESLEKESTTPLAVDSSTNVESKKNNVDFHATTTSEVNDPAESTSEESTTTSTTPIPNRVRPTTEKGGDFFSAFFSGLTKILEPSPNKTKSSNITKSSASSKNTTTTLSTIIDNKTNSENITELLMEKSASTSTVSNVLTPQPTGKPVIIKTNPTILDADYNFDYSDPTLPPSLPNLKIIPFLPADAVKSDRKHMNFDYYKHKSSSYPSITENYENWGQLSAGTKNSISKIDYDISYDHTAAYPSITESHDSSAQFENSDDPASYAFASFEYPETGEDNPFGKTKYDMPAKGFDALPGFAKTEPPIGSRFSPPEKTEGGFVPKDPAADPMFYETYLTTKQLLDQTTPALKPLVKDASKTGITTPDPFKDVIKTEPPPDLHSLIEDKEKLLASGATGTLFSGNRSPEFEKDIISITTDATYNFTSEYTDAKDEVLTTTPKIVDGEILNTSTVKPVNDSNTTIVPSTTLPPIESDNKTAYPVDEDLSANAADIENVFNLLFHPSTKIETFTEAAIPPFKALPPEDMHYELIKTLTPGTTPTSSETSNSVEDMTILKDALLSTYTSEIDEVPKPPLVASEKPKDRGSLENMAVVLSEPFNKLPFLKPSFQVKPPKEYHYNPLNSDLDLMLSPVVDLETRSNFNVEGYKVLSNDPTIAKTDSYVVNPVDVDKLNQHQQGGAQVFTKSDSNSINDPAGILKLAGCNIYGRMYRVGRIISELSGPCLECKCTEVGVSCTPLNC